MSDLIDRAEAIRIASGYCHPANIVKELEKLPSVQPTPCEFCKHNNIADDKACLMCSAERRTNE